MRIDSRSLVQAFSRAPHAASRGVRSRLAHAAVAASSAAGSTGAAAQEKLTFLTTR